ncbi:MAG: VCBS repeat-containing protein [bacterium]|nr:VCBS repeat-containing protein [bacterium]MDI1337529.1 VCBS repeat-containing protein [Lacunisphaera sp.]
MKKSSMLLLGTLGLVATGVVGVLVFLLTREQPGGSVTAAKVEQATYAPVPVGFPIQGHPMISHVSCVDLDQDGLVDIIVCDAAANRIGWIRQYPRGVFTEQFIGEPVQGPAHAAVCDINQDGKPDLLIASMGVITPSNDKIGKVVIMENLGGGQFRNHIIAENMARVNDLRGADLNGDGRIDLVVGQFGYVQGEFQWMENLGDWKFLSHQLLNMPGTIMTPVADFDQDGKMDLAALVSQDSSQVYGQVHFFRNLGGGKFEDRMVWITNDLNLGSSGLEVGDVNGDGRPDLVYTNGDGFNSVFAAPAPTHGVQWFENKGQGNFTYHRIGDSAGCYSPLVVDLNGDGKMDIVTVSAFNNAKDSAAAWMTAWMNDGHENFTRVPLTHEFSSLITVAAGDLYGTGVPVLVTGGFHSYPPFENMSRVTLWRRR